MTGVLFAAILTIQGADAFTIVHTNTYAIAASGRKACGLNHSGFVHVAQSSLQQQIKPATQNLLALLSSPLNTKLWLHELAGDEDEDEDEAFLANGIINGFQLVDPNTQFTK